LSGDDDKTPSGGWLYGWLNVNKPVGYRSTRIVEMVKKITRAKKVGHGGTLDPLASGVLPICLNGATGQTEFLMDHSKTYLFNLTFGESRDTYDANGIVVEKNGLIPGILDVENTIASFIGLVDQRPPAYSALRVNGKRAYDLARKGIRLELGSRKVLINILKFSGFVDRRSIQLVVDCGRGCYVRSLAVDIARSLGALGYVSKLIRLRVGNMYAIDSLEIDKLTSDNIPRNLITYR
jgi:tRNA pseudouridine55 synthase